ncbi:helix-turn-helix domain-containing protein [Yokenella regensburgei]|uniref:helix-turn-helix domain-containing protein n=1 Tax=Yokenella regensburgei TaxID=158877 RepID=UPI0031E3B363
MTTTNNVMLPDSRESELAQRSQRELEAYLSTCFETQRISIHGDDDKTHTMELPTSAMTMLVEILGELAAGNAVQIVPVQAELTTQEAANILNVSRPHMVKLLEEGQLPFHKIGRHRRILFADLMKYKSKREHESLDAMQALADQAQDLGML